MLDYGFDHYKLERAYAQGQVVRSVPVVNGIDAAVDVVAEEALEGAVRISAPVDTAVALPASLDAPVRAGDVVGSASVSTDGDVIARCDLIASRSVEKLDIAQAFRRLLRSWLFRLQPSATP